MAKNEKALVEIYSWKRGNNSLCGNPSLKYIHGSFKESGESFYDAKSTSNAGWVYGVSHYDKSFNPPLLCEITYHYTKSGNMIINTLKEIKEV